MANAEQLKILTQGVDVWNKWREENPLVEIDLSDAYLSRVKLMNADLSEGNLRGTNFEGADSSGAKLIKAKCSKTRFANAKLCKANLFGSKFWDADLMYVDLSEADIAFATFYLTNLCDANLSQAELECAEFLQCYLSSADLHDSNLNSNRLSGCNLSSANLRGTNLHFAVVYGSNLSNADLTNASLFMTNLDSVILVQANLEQATLRHCNIFGLSAWALKGVPKQQSGLIITRGTEVRITIDDLQIAQFIHLLLNNKNVRNVIDTITSKAVLILGRFTHERKAILDVLHAELRKRNYLPILFDFAGPTSRDITETVSTLAHMARFVVADITDAKSIPQELQAIVPNLPSVPVKPILLASQKEYGMFEHFKRYPWVLETYHYNNIGDLITAIPEEIINPLETKVAELRSS